MQQSYNLVSYKIILKEEFLVIRLVQKDGMELKDLSEEFQKSKLVVLAAVKQNDMALEHASDSLKKDKEVALAVVGKNGLALQFAGDRLKTDQAFIQELKKLPSVDFLQYVPQSWKENCQFF